MEVNPFVVWVIAGMALVTVVPRVLPLVLLSRLRLPDWLLRWLSYVPVAVLAALLAREVLLSGSRVVLPPESLGLLAAVPAFAVAIWTRSLMGTVVAGIAAMALLRYLL